MERICHENDAEEKKELKKEVQELKQTIGLLIKSHVQVLAELKSMRREMKEENKPLLTSTPKQGNEW